MNRYRQPQITTDLGRKTPGPQAGQNFALRGRCARRDHSLRRRFRLLQLGPQTAIVGRAQIASGDFAPALSFDAHAQFDPKHLTDADCFAEVSLRRADAATKDRPRGAVEAIEKGE